MALQKEIWIQDIQELLYANNAFLTRSMDDSSYIAYKTVHIPQAGANPSVAIDRASFPASITQRTDSDFTYNVNHFSCDPILITDLDSIQVSYDKRKSVMGQQMNMLTQVIGNKALYNWAPTASASRTVLTTGASGTTLAPSATGTRKAVTLADIYNLRNILDKDNVPQEGRVLVMPADMYNMEFSQINNVQAAYSYGSPVLPTGVVRQIAGFDIYVRSSVVVYSPGSPITAPAIKAIGADGFPSSPAATDCLGAIAFHPDFVSRAQGNIDVAYNAYGTSAAAWFGDIISSYVMFGASPRRSTSVGIAALVQTA